MILKSVIIGLGNIGMEYDYDASPFDLITSHAQALDFHPNYKIVAGIDPNELQRSRFSNKFRAPGFSKLSNQLAELDPDVYVIATPTNSHHKLLTDVLSIHNPKLVLIEKPLSYSSNQQRDFLLLSKTHDTTIAINHYREYDSVYRRFSDELNNGLIGESFKIVIHYTKGIVNNGSHLIRYISNFMGQIIDIDIISSGKAWDNTQDPQPDLVAHFERGHAYFLSHDENFFSHNEMEIVGSRGSLRYNRTNIEHRTVVSSGDFEGYKYLDTTPQSCPTTHNKYQLSVYDNIYRYFLGTEQLLCDVQSMKSTIEFYELLETKINEYE